VSGAKGEEFTHFLARFCAAALRRVIYMRTVTEMPA
jgi:hypothetical protein